MKESSWKIIAIIFMILFLLETLVFGWGYYTVLQLEKNTNDCFFNICNDYPDATFESGVCTCYDYDLMGNLVIAKTEYKK